MKKSLSLFSLAAALLFCGCSTFNREWRQSAATFSANSEVAGPWEGTWASEANGHSGRLRCLLTPVDERHYDARFYAEYKKWITLHFGYTVRLEALKETNGMAVRGAEDLGMLAGGVYRYEGTADPTNFFCTFKSKHDHGTFRMRRPAATGTIPVYSSPERR